MYRQIYHTQYVITCLVTILTFCVFSSIIYCYLVVTCSLPETVSRLTTAEEAPNDSHRNVFSRHGRSSAREQFLCPSANGRLRHRGAADGGRGPKPIYGSGAHLREINLRGVSLCVDQRRVLRDLHGAELGSCPVAGDVALCWRAVARRKALRLLCRIGVAGWRVCELVDNPRVE